MFTFFKALYDVADIGKTGGSGDHKFFCDLSSAKTQTRLWNASPLTALQMITTPSSTS
jgi:hypothetical protein